MNEYFPEEIVGKSATPVANYLFKVRNDGKNLDKEQADAFHCTVYQLLFAENCARWDIQTAAFFLTMRVQELGKDSWGKLKRILKYLNGTRNLKLTLSLDQLKFIIHLYVDASHQVHKDSRGQTGSLVTLRKGAISSSSNKRKCNTKNLTNTEFISFADKLTEIIWMCHFIEYLGYDIDEYVIFKDNMSTFSLEKNG